MAYDDSFRAVTFTCDSSLAGYTGVPGTPGSANPNYGIGAYRFAKITGKRQVGRAAAATDKPKIVGVNYSKPQVPGEACTVAIRGEVLVLAGSTWVAGDSITCDAQGRAIKSADGSNELAIAVEDATAVNSLSTVLLRTN